MSGLFIIKQIQLYIQYSRIIYVFLILVHESFGSIKQIKINAFRMSTNEKEVTNVEDNIL